MTRDEIVQLVRDSLGFNTALDEAIILRHMARVQDKYERGHDSMPLPYFCFDPLAKVYTVNTVRYSDVPTNFVDFSEDWPLTIVTADGVTKPLERKPFDDLAPEMDKVGFPEYFDTDYAQLHFFPIPDGDYTVNCPCYKTTTAINTTTTSAWFTEFADLLAEETAFSVAKATRDAGFLKTTDVQAKRADYIRRVEAQQHKLRQYVIGGTRA